MKALVTGAAGFLGRHVARAAAARGYEVTGIGHGLPNPSLSDWGVSHWHEADVTLENLRALPETPDVIFHCAGGASVAYSVTHPMEDFRRTVDGTLSVLEYARTAGTAAATAIKVVLPSSAGVYGLAPTLPSKVGDLLNPVSPYGLHKKMAEELCVSYGRQFGLPAAIVRLFSVYGPELRKQLLWDACTRLTKGENTFSGTGGETRDWLHVEDAASLLLAAVDHAGPDVPIVNGAAGVAVEVRDVVQLLAESLPGAQPPRFSGERRIGDPEHYHADIAGALAWGWKPRQNWRDGISGYATWFGQVGE